MPANPLASKTLDGDLGQHKIKQTSLLAPSEAYAVDESQTVDYASKEASR